MESKQKNLLPKVKIKKKLIFKSSGQSITIIVDLTAKKNFF